MPKGQLLETYSLNALVNVDGVFGHYLADGRMAALFLASLLCGSHYDMPLEHFVF